MRKGTYMPVRCFPIRTLFCVLLTALFACGCLGTTPPKGPNPTAPATAASNAIQLVHSFELNSYSRVLDGQWLGIHYASDGQVYFASSTHSAHHGASFFKYDRASEKI